MAMMCRKMYDCIVMATGTLPPGVELIEVLEEAAEAEVAEVMASMPRMGDKLNAQDMVAAGDALFSSKAELALVQSWMLILRHFRMCI